MENCGKVWRQEHGGAGWHERHDTVYPFFVAAGAEEMRACSACAGDYEDPDRTAWTPADAEDEESDGAPCAATDEFPAEE